eukprot:15329853-Ditylum_brightwellii.AAC.1
MLGHKLVVFTGHKNLTQDALGYPSKRIMRWKLLIEEFGPDIKYIQGKSKFVADAISRLNYFGKSQPSDTTLSLEELSSEGLYQSARLAKS